MTATTIVSVIQRSPFWKGMLKGNSVQGRRPRSRRKMRTWSWAVLTDSQPPPICWLMQIRITTLRTMRILTGLVGLTASPTNVVMSASGETLALEEVIFVRWISPAGVPILTSSLRTHISSPRQAGIALTCRLPHSLGLRRLLLILLLFLLLNLPHCDLRRRLLIWMLQRFLKRKKKIWANGRGTLTKYFSFWPFGRFLDYIEWTDASYVSLLYSFLTRFQTCWKSLLDILISSSLLLSLYHALVRGWEVPSFLLCYQSRWFLAVHFLERRLYVSRFSIALTWDRLGARGHHQGQVLLVFNFVVASCCPCHFRCRLLHNY